MNWVVEVSKLILGKELPVVYSYFFVIFVLFCVGFYIWSLYFIFRQNGIKELSKIEWYPINKTVITSFWVIIFSVFATLIVFGYDFVLDQLVNLIMNYAK